jgi:hypothetical protein
VPGNVTAAVQRFGDSGDVPESGLPVREGARAAMTFTTNFTTRARLAHLVSELKAEGRIISAFAEVDSINAKRQRRNESLEAARAYKRGMPRVILPMAEGDEQ